VTETGSGYATITVEGFRGEVAQTVVHEGERGRVVAVDTAYDAAEANRGRDVVVNASYSGVLPARFVGRFAPRAAIGVDCAIGKDGAGIAGLWYFEALGLPAAAADVDTVELGVGIDMYETGQVSVVNASAASCGVERGMPVRDAALLLLERDPEPLAAEEVTNRTVMAERGGRRIVCTDSIAFGLPEDRDANVLCTAGHTGAPAAVYLRRFRPHGFICSDGGKGKNDAGIAALWLVEEDGLAGATVDARTARMGDGLSTYRDGVISACNAPARERGVEVGQPAALAADLLLDGQGTTERRGDGDGRG
jgi:hypothetical protein